MDENMQALCDSTGVNFDSLYGGIDAVTRTGEDATAKFTAAEWLVIKYALELAGGF